nr:unnamed protein product [Spirometra erinaceieuropaei]
MPDTDVLELTGILSIYAILRKNHLVRMDDERLPKRLFYGDVATGSCRPGGQIRRYMDTLKSSLKRLRTVKTDAAICDANRIAAAKAKREARKSQLRPVRNAASQPLPTCPRCQRTFPPRIGLVGHLRINCASRTAPTIVSPAASSCSSPPPTNTDYSSEPPLPPSSPSSSSSSSSSSSHSFFLFLSSSSSLSSSTTVPTVAAQAAVSHITNRDTKTDTTPTSLDSSDEDQDNTCPHCDRTFTSHNGLVGHLRIYRTETGEPVPGAPTYIHRTRLHCPNCPRTFTHRMCLFGHMRIHESGIDHNSDTPIRPSTTLAPSPYAPISTTTTITTTTASFTA